MFVTSVLTFVCSLFLALFFLQISIFTLIQTFVGMLGIEFVYTLCRNMNFKFENSCG